MGVSLTTENLKRYRDIAWLLWKYGRGDLVREAGIEDALGDVAPAAGGAQPSADELASDLEKLGPTYIKLGQLLSTRADLLPPAFLDALARLQDKVEPFPFDEVKVIVAVELGIRLSKAFSEFEAEPMAAASLGQVHRAVLRSGRPVAVKVQRPRIRERMLGDLETLGEIADFADVHTGAGRRFGFRGMLDELRKSLLRELDYRQEARNLVTLAENLEEFDRIVIPRPIEDYSTSVVLTTELVRGQKVTSLNPVVRTDLDGALLAEQLFAAYLQQVLVDGFFHADPHPGNVLLTDDDRIALLDLGMVAHIAPTLQERLLQMLLAISEGRGEEAAEVGITIGQLLPHFDESRFRHQVADLVGRTHDLRMEQVQLGRLVLAFTRLCGGAGIRVPPELMLFAKTLLNLDQIGRSLDPGFQPNTAIRRYAAEITRRRMMKSLSPGYFLDAALEVKDFVRRLPGRVNRIVDLLARNELQVKVNALDEELLMEGFQKVANRISMGLVLAALIVGAAMLVRVPTSFRILGYPGLAMLCFPGAAAGGIALVASILVSDLKARRRHR